MEEFYLDNAATTPCDPRVIASMMPLFGEEFANPHSSTHAAGERAAQMVEAARRDVAALIGADPREVVFTSGATEANNLAIKGAARHRARHGDGRRRIVTVATEHKCVLESVRDLADEGFDPVILGVDSSGRVSADALREVLAIPTALVSIMAANNETGVLQDLPVLSRIAKEAGALFHSDLAQAAGKTAIDVGTLGLDLASVSAHKMYGPKGVGALFVRRRPRVRLVPLFSGGGQERGLRSGTLPSALIAGFGCAARIAAAEGQSDARHLAHLAGALVDALHGRQVAFSINAAEAPRLPGILSLRLSGVPALALMQRIPELALSAGSACSSAGLAPSYVLTAMGLSPAEAAESLRLSPGRFTTPANIARAADLIVRAAHQVRGAEPAWARSPSDGNI
ncbi:cysteine desulfurase family protein [Acetobacter oeni]|uniref:Cysteine desulfurase n=1 Tax=Acetobacter oeni TaxID=304077 RepID=A0A511XLT0_9PROT|nr:cysteine desulfurase family protein [Acetobacter oeni]MBB3882978.1 cysteine desulfurase [Acetobacter oeni]NHO19056.1 aminotransferase class V-fold PLP-dependent enzyme [Acetobacter oeni]GEN63903.1 cysteine desulfurase IscS [Acetobacter oeni]